MTLVSELACCPSLARGGGDRGLVGTAGACETKTSLLIVVGVVEFLCCRSINNSFYTAFNIYRPINNLFINSIASRIPPGRVDDGGEVSVLVVLFLFLFVIAYK